jgi:glycosyltransferase involved in cell wall biosynthesis
VRPGPPLSPLDAGRVAAVLPAHLTPPAPELVAAVARHVGELLLVDDGMPAPAAAELAVLAATHGAGLLRLPQNQGKGHAVAAARRLLLSRPRPPEALVVVDADGQHPPEALPLMLAAAAGAELVIGDRSHDPLAMPLVRRLANRGASNALSVFMGARIPDSQCGLRVIRGRALHQCEYPTGRYEAETRHLKRCLRAGVRVAWVPIPVLYGDEGSSFRPMRDGARVLASLVAG